MSQPESDRLVADLSRDVVSAIAPEELPLFRAQSEAFFADPEAALHATPPRDNALGFGVALAVQLLTPIILSVMKEAVQFLVDELQQSAKEEASGTIAAALKSLKQRLFASKDETSEVPALTEAQLERIRNAAHSKARDLQLSEEQCTLLADAVVGRLAVAGG